LNTARELHTATISNGMVLIAGGHSSDGALASAELYDPVSGTFTPAGSLNAARLSHTATLLNDGTVLIAGGYDQSGSPTASAELYNPATNRFMPTLSLNAARYRHTATLLNGGAVLIAGGEDSNGNAISSTEIYNPATGTFVPDGTLNIARILHSATLLNNGTDLMAGGYGSNSYLNAAEVNDPTAGTFVPTGSLNTARYLHTATLLNNGMDLVAGGHNSNGYLGSAELYEPATLTPPNLVSIALSPADLTLPLGAAQQFVATGTFNDGTTQQLASVIWNSSSTAVATINSDASSSGVADALGQGNTTLSACAGAVCGSTSLTVGPAALVLIAVSPANGTVPSGESLQFSATGTYSDGSSKQLNSGVQWSSADPSVATITAAGVASGVSMGGSNITATVGNVAGTAALTVTGAAIVALNIQPSAVSMVLGSSRQLRAIASFSDGTTQDVTATAIWSATQPAIASVNSRGLVTANRVGSTTIMASASGLTASASVTVTPLLLLTYFNLSNAQNSGDDGVIRLVNPGLVPGDLCAMIYVFDRSQEMNECCGCKISDSGLLTLSLINDLTANTLTGTKPVAGAIEIIPSNLGQGASCNAGNPSPDAALSAWSTHVQGSPGAYNVTEEAFSRSMLSVSEATILATECSMIQQLGSGQGICTCGSGG
jgi:hypothetical protein